MILTTAASLVIGVVAGTGIMMNDQAYSSVKQAIGGGTSNSIGQIDISGMDIETALKAVQEQRASLLDQQLNRRRMPLVGGPHQRSGSAQCFFRVGVRAVIEQYFYRTDVAGAWYEPPNARASRSARTAWLTPAAVATVSTGTSTDPPLAFTVSATGTGVAVAASCANTRSEPASTSLTCVFF